MTDFIKEQQKLAMEAKNLIMASIRNWDDSTINVSELEHNISEELTVLVTNIGKELLRRIEETDNTFSFTDSRYIKKDTMKQHITSVTGAYE